jgi:hypothetical protein
MVQGPLGSLFKRRICLPLSWNGSVIFKFIPKQPHKGLFIVTVAVPACPVVYYLRVWGRSTLSAEVVMRLLKRDPTALFFADGSFKALNCYPKPKIRIAG